VSQRRFLATLQPDNTWYCHDSQQGRDHYGQHIDDCLKALAREGDRITIEIGYYQSEQRPLSRDDIQWLTGTGYYGQ
jgi:hypothetical protein